jgi:hypothetical protein
MRPAGTRCICELYWHNITSFNNNSFHTIHAPVRFEPASTRDPTATHHLSLHGLRYKTLLTTCQTSSPVEVWHVSNINVERVLKLMPSIFMHSRINVCNFVCQVHLFVCLWRWRGMRPQSKEYPVKRFIPISRSDRVVQFYWYTPLPQDFGRATRTHPGGINA